MTTPELCTVPKPDDRGEWLALRHPFYNASAAAALFDEHPYQTLADVAAEKLAPVRDDAPTRAMERGIRLEDAVANWWADEHGVQVETVNVLHICGRLMATLDRAIVGSDTDAVEVKTTKHRVSEPKRYWWWQTQAQMACTGFERVHLAVVDGDMDLATYTIERDDDAIDRLLAEVERFFDFIDLGLFPEGVTPTYEHLRQLHPEPVVAKVELDDAGAEAVTRWQQADAAAKAASAEADAAKAEVAALLGDAEEAHWGGAPLVTWRAQSRRSVDTRRLEAEFPEAYAATYGPGTPFRVLRLSGKGER